MELFNSCGSNKKSLWTNFICFCKKLKIYTYFHNKKRAREEKRKEYFLTCCAFTFIGNSHLGDNYDYKNERDKLKEIGKRIGIPAKEIDTTISKIFKGETEENGNTNNHTGVNKLIIKRFIKVLYDIAFLLYSENLKKEEREDIFNFICIKFGIFNNACREEIRKEIFDSIKECQCYEKVKEIFHNKFKDDKYLENYFNIDDLNFNYIINLDNYFNAILNSINHSIEQNKEDSTKEANDAGTGDSTKEANDAEKEKNKGYEKLKEIEIDHIKNFENYWNNLHGNDLSPKQMAELVYDLFTLIWADSQKTREEDWLFKFCSIICRIRRIKLIKIKQILYRSIVIEKNANKIIFNQRQRTIKQIQNTLEKDYTITANEKARFALVCSLAYADNKFGEKERYELYKIGLHDYILKIEDIENIISEIEKHKTKDKNSISHNLLLHIPENIEDKFADLIRCYNIIYSDNEITNTEKNMFEIICMFYGVRSQYFSSNMYLKYDSRIPREYLREIDINGNVRFNFEDYSKINDLLNHRLIGEPFMSCVEMATRKKFEESQRATIRHDRVTTGFAFTTFMISAIILLTIINTTAHGSFNKNSFVQSKDSAINAPSNNKNDVTLNDSESVACNLFKHYPYWEDKLVNVVNKPSRYIIKVTDLVKAVKPKHIIRATIWSFICIIILVFLWFIGAYQYIKTISKILLHNRTLRAISFILLITVFFIPIAYQSSIFLLAAMLSIEWLILMREKKQEQEKENGSSKLLTVLVISAILTDISFGMIELEQSYNSHNVADKVFSALFLGCICFFFGKFMELQYNHESEDQKKIKELLGIGIKSVESEKAETQDEKKTAEDKKPETQDEKETAEDKKPEAQDEKETTEEKSPEVQGKKETAEDKKPET